jgi:hypothetical protein
MKVPFRLAAAIAIVPALIASALAFTHMDSIPSYVVMAPGYLVQAWLFERHWALGGAGYAATMIGVSTLFWAGILLATSWVAGRVARHFLRGRAA